MVTFSEKEAERLKTVNSVFALFKDSIESRHNAHYMKIDKNNNRHALFLSHDPNIPRYYALYKPSGFYTTFAKEFPYLYKEEPERAKLGESMNKTYLDIALHNNAVYLVFIYPKHTYYVETMIFKRYSETRGLFRRQKRGEITFSIPIDLLRRFD